MNEDEIACMRSVQVEFESRGLVETEKGDKKREGGYPHQRVRLVRQPEQNRLIIY